MRTLPPIAFLTMTALIATGAGTATAGLPRAASLRPGAGRVVAQAPAPPPGPLVVEADEIAYDAVTNIVTARGHVRIVDPRFRLLADTLSYDLQAQTITAEGRVRLVEVSGRELRGTRIVYAIPQQEGVISAAETIIDNVHVRAGRVQLGLRRLVAEEATVTTCDPARPLYRVTARRVEIIPGEELIARDASLWLGSLRVLTLPSYRVSLREAKGPPLPGAGYNPTDGLWIDYRYAYRLGEVGGELAAKYGQRSGFFIFNTLTYDRPAWRLGLAIGRTQRLDPDDVLHTVTVAEATLAANPRRIGGTPLALSGQVAAGWFDEPDSVARTTRLDGTLALTSDPIVFGRAAVAASAAYRFSAYGTGEQRSVLSGAVTFTYRFAESTTATVRYEYASVRGASPFLFDRVEPARVVGFTVVHARPDFRISAGVSYDFLVPETKVSAGVGARVSPSFFLDIAAVYNTRTQVLDDLDYAVTYRCDCLTVTLRYRQIRQEVSLMVVLGASDRLRFLSPAP